MAVRSARVGRAFHPVVDTIGSRVLPAGSGWYVPVEPAELDAPEPPPSWVNDPRTIELPPEAIVIYPWDGGEPIPISPKGKLTPVVQVTSLEV